MALSQFGLTDLLGSMVIVGGYPILTWVEYLLYVASLFLTFFYATRLTKEYKYKLFFFIYFGTLIVTYFYTLFNGVSVTKLLSSSVFYVMPILIFPALAYANIDRTKIIKAVCLISMAGAVVTVLFILGFLTDVVSDKVSVMERSSVLVDGGLGLVAFALSLYLLLYEGKNFNAFYKYGTLISGLMIVLGGQSRARIIILLLVLALSLLLSIFSGKNRATAFKVLFSIIAVVAVALVVFPDIIGIIDSILERFDTMGTDASSIFRIYERKIQLESFYAHPLLGTGWNGLDNVLVKDLWGQYNHINNHNMYASILAYGGLLYAVPFFVWFLMIMTRTVRKIPRRNTAKLHIILFIILLMLSWSSAGFGKFSQLLSMIVIYTDIINEENIPSPIINRKGQKFRIKFR